MKDRWLEDRDDDISKLFRDNEEQLEETPSFRTWDRVERKLERRRGQKRKVMYRYTSMVAASIGIIAMIYIIGFLDTFSGFDNMAKNTKTESVEGSNEEKQNPSDKKVAVLEKQAEYSPIDDEEDNFAELEESETIVPLKKQEEPIASNFDDQSKNRNNPTSVPSSPKIAERNNGKIKNNPPLDRIDSDIQPRKKVSKPSASWTFPIEEEKETEDMEENSSSYKDNKSNNPEQISEPVIIEDTQLNSQGNPGRSKSSKRNDKKDYSSDRDTYTKKEKADTPAQSYSVNQFHWLNGDWKDISIGGSYENWQIGKNGLSGSGYVIIENDTSFVEQMRIYQRGKDIFFEGPVDASQKTRRFKLESYKGNEAIFNRKGKNFPNQVVITRHTNSSYSIVYQNKDAIKVNTTEQLYFKYRNRLNSQRAARNMTRY